MKKTVLAGNKDLEYLAVESPIDKLTTNIAKKLSNVQEGSPEWAQLLDIVGNPKADRLTIAKFLAEIQYKKASTEQMLERYGISSQDAKTTFDGVWSASKDAVRNEIRGAGAAGADARLRPAAQQSVAANAGLGQAPA